MKFPSNLNYDRWIIIEMGTRMFCEMANVHMQDGQGVNYVIYVKH